MKPIFRLLGWTCVIGVVGVSALTGETAARVIQYRVEFSTLVGGSEYDDARESSLLPDGAALLYATCVGGGAEDLLRSVAIGPKGEVYLVGKTASDDLEMTAGAAQGKRKGNSDAFVLKLVRAHR